jgi:NTE family protein
MTCKDTAKRKALMLSGGGARAAYQVGVLRAVANLLPSDSHNPFQIISGTSAGALNAASLATHAQRLRTGVRTLEYVWNNISSAQVYKLDSAGLINSASNWVFSFLANRRRDTPTSLLDNSPLEEMLEKVIKFERVQRSIDAGYLEALAITASGYSSGESVSFFQGVETLPNWQGPHRVGMRSKLTVKHLLASTAIPTLFPAVRINREYFGDGAIRQLSPLSPAIALGADRILAVGVSSNVANRPEKGASPEHPSLTKILSHILNSAFVDTLISDIDSLRRINKLVPFIPAAAAERDEELRLRKICLLDISPSENLSNIASEYFDDLPKALKMFVRDSGSSTVLSLLMFEKSFCQRLIKLGYADAMEKEAEILDFFREP